MAGDKLRIDKVVELTALAAHLESIAGGLRKGAVTISHGQEAVTITPPPVVDMELDVVSKKDKQKLELKISWKAKGQAGPLVSID